MMKCGIRMAVLSNLPKTTEVYGVYWRFRFNYIPDIFMLLILTVYSAVYP